jgi:MYXO-CTERM domain-containing protein
MRLTIAAVSSVLTAVLLVAGVARADLAPPDTCTSPGQPCQNAGSQYDQAGTCASTTCTKSVRGPDGGLTPMTYACNVCQPSGAGGAGASGHPGGSTGTGGAAGASGQTGGSTGTGGAATSTSGGSSGCAIAGGGADPGAGGLLALIGLGLVVARRRRDVAR